MDRTFSFDSDPNEMRDYYNRQGFLIVDTGVKATETQQIVNDLAPYFGPDRVEPTGVTFANERRIQDAWRISEAVRKMALNRSILTLLKTLYGGVSFRPFQTLNFEKGTQQPVHADSIHFNSKPFGMMCGVWVALEDIGLEQGPLVYYPGTQQLPEMNYPDFDLPSSENSQIAYSNLLESLVVGRGYSPQFASIKQGQAVIWAANIVHGGARQTDLSLSRHSQVTHYYARGIRYWRPSMSEEERYYFTPDWIVSRRREKLNQAVKSAYHKFQLLKGAVGKRLRR